MAKESSNFLHTISSNKDYSVLAPEEEDDWLQPRGRVHPISRTAWIGHVDVVRLLVEHGVGLECRNAAGDRPLCLAAEAGHSEVVPAGGHEEACRVLFEYLEENYPQKAEIQIQKALAAAAQNGKHRIIELLLDRGADINCQVDGSPLTHAARQCRLDTVEFFIEYGADPNTVNDKGEGAFMAAARTGDVPLLELLLDLGVDMDLCGGAALFWAVHDYRFEAVQFLIEQGADLGYLRMDVTVTSIWDVRFIVEDDIDGPMTQLLLKHGARGAPERAKAERREEIAQYTEEMRRLIAAAD
ncbi:hypothetical protein SI65_07911 [Aspergillus cristatus]|uniref:Uncharacterized protein n=1 Tax=Aspergillus cristatus TaxID=573508 RepID=A0A1E3B661_ASPCR|nr:hypothetical protein SI65_07911 [Aspergillus cristatus]